MVGFEQGALGQKVIVLCTFLGLSPASQPLTGAGQETVLGPRWAWFAAHSPQQGFPVARARRRLSQKLTAAHGVSSGVRMTRNEPVIVHYEPNAFENWREMEGTA